MVDIAPKPWFSALILAQVATATVATITDIFIFKISVAALGCLIILIAYQKRLLQVVDVWVVILAFICSMIGDYYLSHMHGNNAMFIWGISLYLLAHIGYLIFSLLNGTVKWKIAFGIALVYLVFFYFILYPKITDKTLALTVLFYLLVSCTSLGAALGIKAIPAVKWPYIFGIILILFSDTIISLKEFVAFDAFNFLILPTYYLAQIGITVALYNKKKFSSVPIP